MIPNGNSRSRDQVRSSLDLDSAGIMAALERAAIHAQRRAIETTGSYAVLRDGKILRLTEIPRLSNNERRWE